MMTVLITVLLKCPQGFCVASLELQQGMAMISDSLHYLGFVLVFFSFLIFNFFGRAARHVGS